MKAIEADNKSLKDVLPKNYASPDLDKRILGDVVDIFTNSIDMTDTEANEDYLEEHMSIVLHSLQKKKVQVAENFTLLQV